MPNKELPNELHNKLENFYQGFVCGVRVHYDHCHECEHFTVRSGWGEYCIASEDFARELSALLKTGGTMKIKPTDDTELREMLEREIRQGATVKQVYPQSGYYERADSIRVLLQDMGYHKDFI